ncbi:PaaI family thioesterase [Paralimibaculum aggregatum]|uniref:PaaI family thioesterase n=1 Tax=Paralimibaculum aggregatum TaxID=3036245 RepID=A0ABQ6LQ89_9RHOB|nr:PaaI family thioesterase [Limibaculum sp. NKW23]GMG84082.1 PaaI family thioesterase [Limibaculum sp. NKW23]
MADREEDTLAAFIGAGGSFEDEGELLTALPHSREIGMRLHGAKDGVALLSIPYDERLVGDPETGVLHGGVITALLDTACGLAVMASRTRLTATATLDLRIDYMRPATRGSAVRARAECYRLTRSIGFARAVAFHEDPADPVASAAGAFILERPKEDAA